MTISKKHLIQLVQLYKKAHMEYELIRPELIKNKLDCDVLDIFDVLKMELEAFGKRNCKNFNDLIFGAEILKAETENKDEVKAIQKTVDYVSEKNNIKPKKKFSDNKYAMFKFGLK